MLLCLHRYLIEENFDEILFKERMFFPDELFSPTINFLHKQVFPQQMVLPKKVFFQNSKNKRF